MAKRRANGEGCITKRKDGKYLVEFQIGIKANGKPSKKYCYTKTQAEAVEKLRELQLQYGGKSGLIGNRVTVSEWCNKWLTEYKHSIKESTAERYRTAIRTHIDSTIGGNKLDSITPLVIQNLINTLSINKSASTVKTVYVVLKSALRRAYDLELITRVVTDGVKIPKIKKEEKVIFTEEQCELFKEEVLKDPNRVYRSLYLLYMNTGARLGELPALTWNDVNLEEGYVYINKQAIVLRNEENKYISRVEYSCKNKSSVRKIFISKETVQMLKQYKEEEKEIAGNLGLAWSEENLVFHTRKYTLLNTRNIQQHFNVLAEKAGIQNVSMHSLRHTYATMLYQKGMSPLTIQKQLGHSSINTSYSTYIHPSDDIIKNDISRLSMQ